MQYIDIKASGAQTASTTGTAIQLNKIPSSALFVLDVTAAATDVGDLLDVYVDVSPDGVNWINAICFTRALGNGGAKKELAKITGEGLNDPDAVLNIAADCASGVTRNIGLLPFIRYRSSITDAGIVNASFTYSLRGIFVQ